MITACIILLAALVITIIRLVEKNDPYGDDESPIAGLINTSKTEDHE